MYECIPRSVKPVKKSNDDSASINKPKEGDSEVQSKDQGACSSSDGKISSSDKVCLSMAERFKRLFNGPQFALGNSYFDKVGKTSSQSQFDRHCVKVKKAFLHGFRAWTSKEKYVKAFSSANWEALSVSQKSAHSLSNCVACATQYEQLQQSFPLLPLFRLPLMTIENKSPQEVNAAVQKATGKTFAQLAASQGYMPAAEVKRIVRKAEKKCIRETQQKCTAELTSELDSSAIQAVYSTDVSLSKYSKLRMMQFFNEPSEQASTKKRFPVQFHECDRFDELKQTLINWDPATTFVASELAKDFNILGTDSSHKIRLLAREVNPSIPGLEIVQKRKSTRRKYPGTCKPIGVPPPKKRLVEHDRLMVDSGILKEGLPCVPVKLRRFRDGVAVEIEAHGRKFPLVEVRQSLLDASEQFMRLHSDSDIHSMSRDDVLGILQLGARYSMQQSADATVEDLKAQLTRFERNRSIWMWHDHSSLASHGILAVMVGVLYDPVVFRTEDEIGRSVQECIEEGTIHMLAHASSTLEDEAILIPERLAELDGLTDEITSSSGIKIVDTLRFFKGDKPAAQFEAGVSCGGNYPCVGCTCHRDRFADFAHAVQCEQRSVKGIQEVALAGHFGRVPGKIKFYEDLTSNQLRLELEKRGVKEYSSDKKGRLETLKHILRGVQRVPSLLLFAPDTTLSELHLSNYYVLPCEPLHDLKGYLAAVLRKLPSILPPCALKLAVSQCLDQVFKKAKLYGSDLRSALVEVAHIFAKSANDDRTAAVSDFITCLVQVSRILYSKDSDRSPKQCLQFYNCAFFLHQLHCELFGESTSTYFHALLIHCPVQHEVVCSRSANTEGEERIFKSAEAAAKCTDRKPENMLPTILKRLQVKRSNKMTNPLLSVKAENSKISLSAAKLPPFKGTIFTVDFVRKCMYAYQAHLQRIGHFLVQGEGVWWHRTADGNVHFHDANDDAEFSDAGPELLHFRDAEVLDALRRSSSCWQEAVDRKVPLPADVIRCYSSCGDVTAIVATAENSILSEPEVSFNGSLAEPVFPPKSSTPVRKPGVCSATAPKPPEFSEWQDALQVEGRCVGEEESVQPMDTEEFSKDDVQPKDTEGFVDMAVEEVSLASQITLQSSVCKAVAKLVGVTPELQEFDHVRSLCKSQGKRAAPVMLEKHKALACQFRKQISLHKRSLESMQLSPSDVGYKECVKNIQICLQLICSLH